MGFFTSRKPDFERVPAANSKSVATVIRSRFYGSRKGKARELDLEKPSFSSPDLAASATRTRTDKNTYTHVPPSDSRPPPSKSAPRPSTDALTMTLAQRLNELSVANSQGLLDDDEYRLLRQSLFERFATGPAVPTETPVVRLNAAQSHARHVSQSRTNTTSYAGSSRTPSIQSKTSVSSAVTSIFRRTTGRRSASSPTKFDSGDTTSVYSNVSRSSTWNLSRRVFTSSLYKRGSEISLVPDPASRSQHDTATIASRRKGDSSPLSTFTPLTPKTSSASLSRFATRSTRRLASGAPPSSFHTRSAPSTSEPRRSISSDADGIFDDERLNSAKEIRAQIEQVEAEGRRLLDAFNGLELGTLTKRHRRVPTLTSPIAADAQDADQLNEDSQSKWTLVPERRSMHRGDNDGLSVHSGRSVGTTLSGTKSMKSVRAKMLPASGLPPHSAPITRKSSFSSVSSRGTSNIISVGPVPPVPGIHRPNGVVHISKSNGQLRLAPVEEGDSKYLSVRPLDDGASEVSRTWSEASGGGALSRSRSRPRRPVDDEDAEVRSMEKELADIRRRRTEVTARYDARLEYLRAKLKGAELRERLLKS